ncbi:MAG: 5-oxoprolinase (ATP-hydrolyzing) subunit [Pseudomonadota bacterium]|nr:5-oxoprolinase (ATP-hydrolyzing) subunit [Pseudomonadota bacterium]
MNGNAATLRIVFPGALASVQDSGRPGLRKVGVPRAGALELGWLRIANALVGNAQDAAAIEFFGGGLVLRAEAEPLRVGLAGHFSVEVIGSEDRREKVSGWRSVQLLPGQQLRCGMTLGSRVGYVAVAGLNCPRLLGSASTYARAGFGRLLGAGDVLEAVAASGHDLRLATMPTPEAAEAAEMTIRVVPGPQADYFAAATLASFFAAPLRVTAESDRMGMRLDGVTLVHLPEKGADIASDATVPGSIQVPGNGKPIVLLNDGQTAGGYPKIATVISADLPRLAVLPVGAALRFVPVSVAEAEAAARDRELALRETIANLVPLIDQGSVDLDALYGGNLLSGMVNAVLPD